MGDSSQDSDSSQHLGDVTNISPKRATGKTRRDDSTVSGSDDNDPSSSTQSRNTGIPSSKMHKAQPSKTRTGKRFPEIFSESYRPKKKRQRMSQASRYFSTGRSRVPGKRFPESFTELPYAERAKLPWTRGLAGYSYGSSLPLHALEEQTSPTTPTATADDIVDIPESSGAIRKRPPVSSGRETSDSDNKSSPNGKNDPLFSGKKEVTRSPKKVRKIVSAESSAVADTSPSHRSERTPTVDMESSLRFFEFWFDQYSSLSETEKKENDPETYWKQISEDFLKKLTKEWYDFDLDIPPSISAVEKQKSNDEQSRQSQIYSSKPNEEITDGESSKKEDKKSRLAKAIEELIRLRHILRFHLDFWEIVDRYLALTLLSNTRQRSQGRKTYAGAQERYYKNGSVDHHYVAYIPAETSQLTEVDIQRRLRESLDDPCILMKKGSPNIHIRKIGTIPPISYYYMRHITFESHLHILVQMFYNSGMSNFDEFFRENLGDYYNEYFASARTDNILNIRDDFVENLDVPKDRNDKREDHMRKEKSREGESMIREQKKENNKIDEYKGIKEKGNRGDEKEGRMGERIRKSGKVEEINREQEGKEEGDIEERRGEEGNREEEGGEEGNREAEGGDDGNRVPEGEEEGNRGIGGEGDGNREGDGGEEGNRDNGGDEERDKEEEDEEGKDEDDEGEGEEGNEEEEDKQDGDEEEENKEKENKEEEDRKEGDGEKENKEDRGEEGSKEEEEDDENKKDESREKGSEEEKIVGVVTKEETGSEEESSEEAIGAKEVTKEKTCSEKENKKKRSEEKGKKVARDRKDNKKDDRCGKAASEEGKDGEERTKEKEGGETGNNEEERGEENREEPDKEEDNNNKETGEEDRRNERQGNEEESNRGDGSETLMDRLRRVDDTTRRNLQEFAGDAGPSLYQIPTAVYEEIVALFLRYYRTLNVSSFQDLINACIHTINCFNNQVYKGQVPKKFIDELKTVLEKRYMTLEKAYKQHIISSDPEIPSSSDNPYPHPDPPPESEIRRRIESEICPRLYRAVHNPDPPPYNPLDHIQMPKPGDKPPRYFLFPGVMWDKLTGRTYERRPSRPSPSKKSSSSYQAGPSTSYQAGPSSSYQAGPSSSYQAGPSSSYQAGPSTSHQAGPSSSHQAGSSSSYQVGPSTSCQAGPSSSYQADPSSSYQASSSSSYQAGPSTSSQAGPSSSIQADPSSSIQADPSSSYQAGPSSSYQAGPSSSCQAGPSLSCQAGPSSSFQAGLYSQSEIESMFFDMDYDDKVQFVLRAFNEYYATPGPHQHPPSDDEQDSQENVPEVSQANLEKESWSVSDQNLNLSPQPDSNKSPDQSNLQQIFLAGSSTVEQTLEQSPNQNSQSESEPSPEQSNPEENIRQDSLATQEQVPLLNPELSIEQSSTHNPQVESEQSPRLSDPEEDIPPDSVATLEQVSCLNPEPRLERSPDQNPQAESEQNRRQYNPEENIQQDSLSILEQISPLNPESSLEQGSTYNPQVESERSPRQSDPEGNISEDFSATLEPVSSCNPEPILEQSSNQNPQTESQESSGSGMAEENIPQESPATLEEVSSLNLEPSIDQGASRDPQSYSEQSAGQSNPLEHIPQDPPSNS